jgi:hypothetical protein
MRLCIPAPLSPDGASPHRQDLGAASAPGRPDVAAGQVAVAGCNVDRLMSDITSLGPL